MVKIKSRKRTGSSIIRLPNVSIVALCGAVCVGYFALLSIKSNNGLLNNIIRTYFSTTPILSDLHGARPVSLWNHLLREGEALYINSRIHVMEVGMQNSRLCEEASEFNAQAHCVEPCMSPYNKFRTHIVESPNDIRDNIRLYHMAGSDTTGLDFELGRLRSWKMTKRTGKSGISKIYSVAIDDIIDNKVRPTEDFSLNGRKPDDKIDKLFMLKIDAEGNEPKIFAGMQRAIQEHKIDFIITRYWPKGIDLVNDSMGPQECTKPVGMLTQLREAGYTLYTMVISAHATAPRNEIKSQMYINPRIGSGMVLPIDDLMAHCMWFYEHERKYPDPKGSYQMGYWTDILAVAPGARLPERPITDFGRIVAKHMK